MRWSAVLFVAALAFAQHEPARQKAEHAANQAGEHGTSEHGNPNEIWWKWANFAVLAAGLGYLIAKNAGPFFVGRTAAIRKGIEESEQARAEAEARMREIDARLARLGGEVETLQRTATGEQSALVERIRQETAAEIDRIQAHARQEIEAAAKGARLELKRHAAQLAVQLAEHKIRQRMSPEAQDTLVRSFAQRVPGGTT
jgi:F0F1-type ATP synthase membrane subunit b/b'